MSVAAVIGHQTWLDSRRSGLGGSEISAVLGLDPFRGPLDVWLSKVEHYDQPTNPDMERGTFLESGIADWYAHREDVKSFSPVTSWRTAHPNGIARCTPDRLIEMGDGVTLRDLSIKCPRRGGDAWGEHGGTRVPMYCAVQLQWEDAVLTAANPSQLFHPEMHLAALVDGELRVYTVDRDVAFQRELLERGAQWWARHVVGKVAPDLDGGNGAHDWLRRRFPKDLQPSRKATLAEDVLLERLSESAQALDIAELRRDIARQEVEQAIGDAGGLEGATTRVTWRANSKGTRMFKPTYAWRTK